MIDLPAKYFDFCSRSIGDTGIMPCHAFGMRENGALDVHAVLGPVDLMYQTVVKLVGPPESTRALAAKMGISEPVSAEVIYSYDRYTLPEDECEFADALGGAHWRRSHNLWRPFMLPYRKGADGDPVMRPYVWNNATWNAKMMREIRSVFGADARSTSDADDV